MATKFVLLKDNQPVQQFVLSKELTVIGRQSDSDILIEDPAVSSRHAEVKVVGENYLIFDAGSTNGVHIKGQRIKQRILKHEDVVTIGEHQLKFYYDANATIVTTTKAEQVNGKPPSAEDPVRKSKEAAPPAKAKTPAQVDKQEKARQLSNAFLRVLSGKDIDKKIRLNEALTTIGVPGVQMAAVSMRPQGHFIIHVDGGKDKSKVPLVNGEPTGFKSRQLEDGDNIEVAGIEMQYELTSID